MAEISKQALIVENNTSFPNNNNGAITPTALRSFNTDMIDSTVNQTVFNDYTSSITGSLNALVAFTSSVNAFTQSADARLDSLENYTSSNDAKVNALIAFTSSVLSISSLIPLNEATASLNLFTQSADARLDSLESKSGSYATTGSNNFNGSQTITGSLVVTGTITANEVHTIIESSSVIFSSGSNILGDAITDTQTLNGQVVVTGDLRVNGLSISGSSYVTASFSSNNIELTKGDGNITTLIGVASTGSNVFTGTNTFTVGQTTFSSQIVFDNNADLSNYSGSTWTFGLSGTTGSNYTLKSNPFDPVLLITRESDNAKPLQIDWRDNKITLAESGSVEISPNAQLFKSNTTSSFYGNAVWMIAEGFTSSLAFVTASVSGSDSNLIFKNNSLTTAVVVSGSSNIFQIPSAPTAGFTRYIGGGNNLLLTSASVPQLTGSTGIYPQFAGNITSTGAYTFRTPVSSSAWTVTSNILTSPGGVNFGSAAGTSMVSASAGLTFSNNIINAGVNITAYKTTLVSSPIISTNSLGGTVNINLDSSSIQLANATAQGTLTINNSYSGSTASGNSLQITAGNIFVGTGNILYASGSNTTLTTGRQIIGSAIFGSANSASVNLLGDNSNLIATSLIGHGLSITGSSLLSTGNPTGADRGTVIVGRFNAQALSNNTVFAVGTGTSGSAGITRRTGLSIDSGSNSTFSGSVAISGSITSNVVALSITSQTASLDFNSGNLFTLTLVSGSTTRLESANIKAGQTINLLVTQPSVGYGDLVYGSTFKYSSGNSYVPTQAAAASDIVTFLTFSDTTAIYGASVKNLV